MDFYERALFNGLIGNQNRLAPYDEPSGTTGFIYMLPLGGGGITKPWGASNVGFPCCWGTLSETFAKLPDSIWFSATDNATVYVNLFVSSTVVWARPGGAVTLTQDAGFPYDPASTTVVTVSAVDPGAATFTLAVRVPFWASAPGNVFSLNGVPVSPAPAAGSYATITRTWAAGDRVDVFWQPFVRWEPLNDWRASFAGVGAIMYGSVLLAGLTTSDALPGVDPARIAEFVTPVPAPPGSQTLNFTAASECAGANITLIPLMDVMFEQYAVYFKTGTQAVIGYNASGVSVIDGSYASWSTTGGASVLTNGPDWNIRSGDPQEVNTATLMPVVQDPTHAVVGLNWTYRYVSGYGPAGAHVGTNFSLVATTVCGQTVSAPLYTSPELTQYPFDVCNTCYSPPVNVYLPPGSINIPVTTATRFMLVFHDNDRNIQMDLPASLTIFWGAAGAAA